MHEINLEHADPDRLLQAVRMHDVSQTKTRPDPIMNYLEETEDVVAMVLAVISTLIQIQKTMDQLIPEQQEGVEGDLTP